MMMIIIITYLVFLHNILALSQAGFNAKVLSAPELPSVAEALNRLFTGELCSRYHGIGIHGVHYGGLYRSFELSRPQSGCVVCSGLGVLAV